MSGLGSSLGFQDNQYFITSREQIAQRMTTGEGKRVIHHETRHPRKVLQRLDTQSPVYALSKQGDERDDDFVEDDDPKGISGHKSATIHGLNALRALAVKGQVKHIHTRHATARRDGHVPGLPEVLLRVLQNLGQYPLYSHQAEAYRTIISGKSVVVATPTASGKSLVFYLPVLESILSSKGSERSLFMFPLKALGRDQLEKFRRYLTRMKDAAGDLSDASVAQGVMGTLEKTEVHSYDGDTPEAERADIRKRARVIMTNPDMLHCSILPHHHLWAPFLKKLRYIIIDEAHHYRGAFGSHFAMVIRRLLRICRLIYNSEPQVIAATATIGNPSAHIQNLTSLHTTAVTESGAPSGEKQVVMWQPPVECSSEGEDTMRSPFVESAEIVADLMGAGLQTLAFVPARKLTEIVSKYVVGKVGFSPSSSLQPQFQTMKPNCLLGRMIEVADSGFQLMKRSATRHLQSMVTSYRAGYSAADRRRIEGKLAAGELRGLVSTNALELGIDVGELDATVHVGVPAHMHELWQQDTYYMQNPELYFSRQCEDAVLDVNNAGLLRYHLMFAACETPLRVKDIEIFGCSHEMFKTAINDLLTDGFCIMDPGAKCFRPRQEPPRALGIRGRTSMSFYTVVNISGRSAANPSGEVVEEIDDSRVDSVAHEGAIILHQQEAYIVEKLDRQDRLVLVKPYLEPHFTVAKEQQKVTISWQGSTKTVGAATAACGDIIIHHHVTGFQKQSLASQKVLMEKSLSAADYPATKLSTTGMWIIIPLNLASRLEKKGYDVGEAVQGIKNLMTAMVSQLVLCDSRDIRGHAEALHQETQGPVIFIFDFLEGGIGISSKIFQCLNVALLEKLLEVLRSCGCTKGCPSCLVDKWTNPSDTAKAACKMMLEGIVETWMDNNTPATMGDLCSLGMPD